MSTDPRTVQKNGGMVRFKSDWRHKSRVVGSMDDEQMGTALTVYASCGRKTDAAKAAGVSSQTLKHYQDSDPDFAEAMEEALDYYRDKLTANIENRALNGTMEPVIGGKNKDEVVAHIQRFETSLTMMHARRFIPEYSEKYQIEHGGQIDHGVLVVGRPSNLEGPSWEQAYGGKIPAGSLDLPMAPALAGVDVEPTNFEKDPEPLGWEGYSDRNKRQRKAEEDGRKAEIQRRKGESGGAGGTGENPDSV
jgi:hypothetical protein